MDVAAPAPPDGSVQETFCRYLARQLIAQQGFVPGGPPQVAEIAAQSDYVLGFSDGYSPVIVALIDREANPDKGFTLPVERKITPKKVFPGYVLVEMIMDDQSWYVVRNTQGVTGFVGSPGPGEKPVPLQDKEVKTILKQMGIEAPKLKIDFKKGDRVKVTSGPFFDFTGVVDEIAPEKERLRALISIFGRETPVELEFFQVEKV